MKNLLFPLLLLCVSYLNAQVPTTNIYLFDYEASSDGTMVLNNPRIISANNINGYNNQPKWFSANQLYTTRQKAGNDQTDIVVYDIDKKTETLFTKTRQSEYSATPTPDGNHLTCIRVEDDGTQVLWKYPLDRSHGGQRILSHLKDIGYHHWINETEVILFIVDNPMRMVLANTENEESQDITTKIGRCFGEMNSGEILFVYKYTDDIWHLKAFDPLTKKTRYVAQTPPESEDFTLLKNGSILMGQGSKLMRLDAPFSKWVEIADLSSYEIGEITRLTYQGGKIVIVGQ